LQGLALIAWTCRLILRTASSTMIG
jgi:hypothetical protein